MTRSAEEVLSRRVASIEPSVTLEVSALATALKAQGHRVIAFAAGEPDLETPPEVQASGIAAIRENRGRYTPAAGLPALREALARKFQGDGFPHGADQVMACAGAKSCLFLAFYSLLNDGDEVIFPTPFWSSYPDMVRAAGGVPVSFPTSAEADFQPTAEDLAAAITPRSRLLLLNSPNNPTGTVYSRETLEALAPLVRKHDLIVITDDIYETLIYSEEPFRNILHVAPDLMDQVVLINGLSKSHSMTGWRMGFAAGPRPVIDAMSRLQSQIAGNAPSISQHAAITALGSPPEPDRLERMDSRRQLLIRELDRLDGVTCPVPRGAFYAFPSIAPYLGRSYQGKPVETATDFSRILLEEKLVASVTGAAFGAPEHIRLTYTVPEEDIIEGVRRLAEFLAELA